MKICITGASGFVGTNLSKYLEQYNYQIQKFSFRENTLSQIDTKSQAIIHLAGKAHDTKNIANEKEYFEINTELTKQLFDYFISSSINDFIYFSSVKAAADEVEKILLEDELPNPKTPYGRSKLSAEEYILSKQLPENKRLIIIRPCMIHGPNNKGNLNLLYKVVSKGIPYPLGNFKNERSFLSIANLNFVLKSILEKKSVKSDIYNLCDDAFISTNRIIEIIASVQNKKPRIWYLPTTLINNLARLGDILKLPLNSERLKKLTENYRVSNNKIKLALEIENMPTKAEDGLLNTIRSFR